MGTMDLDTTTPNFRDELVFNLKNRADQAVDPDRLDSWINAAYRHMCLPTVHDFREVHSSYDITLVSGTSTYSISEATVGEKIVSIRSVLNIIDVPETATSTKRRLAPRHIQWFDRRTLVSGSPSVFAVEGEYIHIGNVPGASEAGQLVRVRYWREPAALTTGQTTVLPSYYDDVLILGSKWVAESRLGYREAAEVTKQDYIGLLNEGPDAGQLESLVWDHQVDINPSAQGELMP